MMSVAQERKPPEAFTHQPETFKLKLVHVLCDGYCGRKLGGVKAVVSSGQKSEVRSLSSSLMDTAVDCLSEKWTDAPPVQCKYLHDNGAVSMAISPLRQPSNIFNINESANHFVD